ncbi:zona pellucida sperm-binding protein 3 [Cynoglossus semilaevis]|nr:zona pellucida sperm-binding protein 3-like [Cynoglossus semilaevis]
MDADRDGDVSSVIGRAPPVGRGSKPTMPSFPEYVRLPVSKYSIKAFKPGKGHEPLPEWAKEILLVPFPSELKNIPSVEAAAAPKALRPKYLEMLCHIDRIYVRIRREVFKSTEAYKGLKLGKCPVNQGTKDHYYLLHLLKTDCGYQLESKPDYLAINIMLNYVPSGSVIRELPFNIPLQCRYHRLFHSYKIGFYPKLKGGTVFRALQPKQSVILVPLDASGNVITAPQTYTLGQAMYFMAKKANDTGSSENRRMYINKCFMTASQNPNSSPKYVVINNQGCMVDGKQSHQSKFLTSSSKIVQKFTVGAFIFKDMISTSSFSQQLYMHCEVSMGKLTLSSSSKACNYDLKNKRWEEIYGDDSVCACCETTCPTIQPRASRKTISSPSWQVDLSNDGSVHIEPLAVDADGVVDSDMADDLENYWEDEE